jgi:hypothetical protein
VAAPDSLSSVSSGECQGLVSGFRKHPRREFRSVFQCLSRFRQALVPSDFRLQVNRMAQKYVLRTSPDWIRDSVAPSAAHSFQLTRLLDDLAFVTRAAPDVRFRAPSCGRGNGDGAVVSCGGLTCRRVYAGSGDPLPTHLLPFSCWLAKFADDAAHYSVPELRWVWRLGTHSSPGSCWNAARIRNRAVRPFTVSLLDPADNPRRLVATDDDSNVSLCSYPSATLLDGIRCWVQRDRLSFPLHGLRISRERGEGASPRPWRDRDRTCTKLKLSKTSRSSSSIPDCESHFGGTGRTYS